MLGFWRICFALGLGPSEIINQYRPVISLCVWIPQALKLIYWLQRFDEPNVQFSYVKESLFLVYLHITVNFCTFKNELFQRNKIHFHKTSWSQCRIPFGTVRWLLLWVFPDAAVHFHHLTNIVLSELLVSSHCLFWPHLFFLNIPDDHIYTHHIFFNLFYERKL